MKQQLRPHIVACAAPGRIKHQGCRDIDRAGASLWCWQWRGCSHFVTAPALVPSAPGVGIETQETTQIELADEGILGCGGALGLYAINPTNAEPYSCCAAAQTRLIAEQRVRSMDAESTRGPHVDYIVDTSQTSFRGRVPGASSDMTHTWYMDPLPPAAQRRQVNLTTRQRLVIAAYASTSFSRDAALVLSCSIEEFEQQMLTIRQAFRLARYPVYSRQALIRSAQRTGYLPGITPH